MLGAFIGDLAATTWEKDKAKFFSLLVMEKAMPSAYGHSLLASASLMLGITQQERIDIQEGVACDSTEFKRKWLMWRITAAWFAPKENTHLHQFAHIGKLEEESAFFVSQLILSLLAGATKSQAFHTVENFEANIKISNFKNPQADENLLTYVYRAWDSFYRSFDFTSAIHNAMTWPGDKHLLSSITGAFAEAMYGCQYRFIKRKYAKEGVETSKPIFLPVSAKIFGYPDHLFNYIKEKEKGKRSYYPKNEAFTNVERHTWTKVPCARLISFTEEEKERILLASPTSWDNRYGLYLEDGWLYCYRSGVILGRFQLDKKGNHWWITSPQCSNESDMKHFWIAMSCAFTETCHVVNQHLTDFSQVLEHCKYYHGEEEVPSKWKDTTKGKFWYGEMRFALTCQSIKKWQDIAKECGTNLPKDKQTVRNKLSPTQIAIVTYTEELFAKWSPYDNRDWIFEY